MAVSASLLGMLLPTTTALFEKERKEPGRIFKVEVHFEQI